MPHGPKHANASEASSHSCDLDDKRTSSSDISKEMLSESSSDQSSSKDGSEIDVCLKDVACLKINEGSGNPKHSESFQWSDSSCSSTGSTSCKDGRRSPEFKADSTTSGANQVGEEDGAECSSASTKSLTESSRVSSLSQDNKFSITDGTTWDKTERKTPMKAKVDNSRWSMSEDLLLRGMKEANDGISWEDVSKSLNRSKGECKGRWKTIKDLTTAEDEQRIRSKVDGHGREGIARKAEAKDKYEATEPLSPVSQRTKSSPDAGAISASAEHQSQKRYWHEHIGNQLYPPSIRIMADAHFTPHDCKMLEFADARYRSIRWLEMQAQFYNETGRMVPLEMIQKKCEDATASKTDDISNWLDSITSQKSRVGRK